MLFGLPCLSIFLNHPQAAPQACGRGRCPLGYGPYGLASLSSSGPLAALRQRLHLLQVLYCQCHEMFRGESDDNKAIDNDCHYPIILWRCCPLLLLLKLSLTPCALRDDHA
jgi:hypothetical protein